MMAKSQTSCLNPTPETQRGSKGPQDVHPTAHNLQHTSHSGCLACLLAAAVQTNLSGNDDETSQDLGAMLGSLVCEVMNLSRFWS